ncbi:MAG: imidazole glycerol phosphate synthase cyclase subunit [Rhodospirillaceae bacterium]|jgi:cyclase
MLRTRLIACIVVKDGIAVQSIGFNRFLPIGSPAILAENLNRWGVDEILLQDISKPRNGETPSIFFIRSVAAECLIPLTAAGGVKSVDDVRDAVFSGADKVAINTAAIEDPKVIETSAERFGAQCIVASIDAKEDGSGGYEVFTHAGSKATGEAPDIVAKRLEDHGAGEILINAIHRDGSKQGYDLKLIKQVTKAVMIPVIVCGGVGHPKHFVEGAKVDGVTAVAAANFFSFTEHSVLTAKAYLAQNGIGMRCDTYADYQGHQFEESGRVAKPSEKDLAKLVFQHYPEEVI